MKTFIKFLAVIAMFLFSLFPTTITSIYAFGGKQAFVDFVTKIPVDRFWLFGIPLLLITYAATVGLLYFVMLMGNRNKPKKRPVPLHRDYYTQFPFYVEDKDYPDLRVEDPNLGSKLAAKYFQ